MSDARRLTANSLSLYALIFSNYFVGLLLFPYIARVLSIEGFGLVGFGMAYALVFQSIVEYGFMISTTANISKNRSNIKVVSEIVTTTVFAKFILVFIAALIFLCCAAIFPMVGDNLLVTTLFFLSSITAALIPDFYFRGMEQMKSIATRAVSTRLLSIALIIAIVRGDEELAFIPAALFVGNFAAVFWAIFVMRKSGFRFSKIHSHSILRTLQEGFMYFLSRISATINQSMGAFAIGLTHSASSHVLGIYSAAWRISSAGEMMLLPVSDSLYPHMINKRDYRLFWKIYTRGLLIWFTGCAFVFIFADAICAILLGPAYSEAGNALRILLFGCFMAFSSNMFGYNALAPIGLAWHANFALLVATAVNFITIGTLVATKNATLTTICIAVAFSNFVIFSYRATIFFRNRALTRFT